MLGTVAYGAQEALQLSHRLNWNQSATSIFFAHPILLVAKLRNLFQTCHCYLL